MFRGYRYRKGRRWVTSFGYGQTALGFGMYPSCTPAAIIAIMDYYGIEAQENML